MPGGSLWPHALPVKVLHGIVGETYREKLRHNWRRKGYSVRFT